MTAEDGAEAGAQHPPIDALNVFVDLLGELDPELESGARGFYDRLCEAACRLTSMERALLLLYDRNRELVVPAGSHGVAPELVALFYGTLDETVVAQRALAEDRVISLSSLEGLVPRRYEGITGVSALTCVPVAAGDRWLGVMFCDCGGRAFELTQSEDQALWMLGKVAALAASARMVTAQQERGRSLAAGIQLARDVHERVMQRLFGVSMVLGADRELTSDDRLRCADELQDALSDLRDALSRPLAPGAPEGPTLEQELARLGGRYKDVPLEVTWASDLELPAELQPLAASALAEALRNAEKHARPSRIAVAVGAEEGAFTLEVRNDGVAAGQARDGNPAPRGAGMGLRLASLEAVRRGGVLEFGAEGEDAWRVRLVLPLARGE